MNAREFSCLDLVLILSAGSAQGERSAQNHLLEKGSYSNGKRN